MRSGVCIYCTISGKMTKDHIIPKCLGGKIITLACKSCNQKKGAFTLKEWKDRLPINSTQYQRVTLLLHLSLTELKLLRQPSNIKSMLNTALERVKNQKITIIVAKEKEVKNEKNNSVSLKNKKNNSVSLKNEKNNPESLQSLETIITTRNHLQIIPVSYGQFGTTFFVQANNVYFCGATKECGCRAFRFKHLKVHCTWSFY